MRRATRALGWTAAGNEPGNGVCPHFMKSGSDPDFLKIAEKVFGYLAAVFLAAMMLLTVADVALRALFNRPIHGTFELIELCLACTIFVALPAVFLRDEHLVVDVVDHFVRPAAVKLLDLFGALASLVVLMLMFSQMVPLGIGASALATVAFIVRWRRGA